MNQDVEQTVAIIKPDGVRRRLVGEIIRRIEQKGLTIVEMALHHLQPWSVAKIYSTHKEGEYFPALVEQMTSGPSVVMILEGNNARQQWRMMMGNYQLASHQAGTIRGDFANDFRDNVVHGTSDTEPDEGPRELAAVHKIIFCSSDVVAS